MAKKETLFFLNTTDSSKKFEIATKDAGPKVFLDTKDNVIEIIFTARGPKNPPTANPPEPGKQKVKITGRIKKESEESPVVEAKYTLSSPSLTYTFQEVSGGKEIGEYVLKFTLNEDVIIVP